MRHSRGRYLSTRPVFLLAACLPYDCFALESGKACLESHGEEVWMCFPKC
jgi:hypothetical protein